MASAATASLSKEVLEDIKLAKEVQKGNISRVKAMLASGARPNGSAKLRPLLTATFFRKPEIVKLLLQSGADVNASVKNPPERISISTCFLPFNGDVALHIAIYSRRVDMVRILLRAGADPNARNADGITPFSALCSVPDREGPWREVARLLLEGGANPSLVDKLGYSALLHAADGGNPEMIACVLSLAPRSLHRLSSDGKSALHVAAVNGNADAVSLLLSAGATHPVTMDHEHCPLTVAVVCEHEDVVRVLVERGLDALGGAAYIVPIALAGAVSRGRRRILRMVLAAEGEEKQTQWTRCPGFMAGTLLHYAAGYIVPGSVSGLLAAGADETAMDAAGQLPIDVIGTMDTENPPISPLTPRTPTRKRDPVKEAEIRRMLLRAPAFRARSWMWPAAASGTAGGERGGGDGSGGGGGGPVTELVTSSAKQRERRRREKVPTPLSPRWQVMLRPSPSWSSSSSTNGAFFARLVDR